MGPRFTLRRAQVITSLRRIMLGLRSPGAEAGNVTKQPPLDPRVALGTGSDVGPVEDPDWEALGRKWWSHVQVLADTKMEGRETGGPGMARSAAYVMEQFRAMGLQPAGVDGYSQPMDYFVAQIDPSLSSLELLRDGEVRGIALGVDAVMVATSRSAETLEAEAAFVGYGLTIPELKYEDLAGQDLKDKVAVYVQGGPEGISGTIKAHCASPYERVRALTNAGAVGLIFIPNPKVPEGPFSRMAIALRQPSMELRDPGPGVPSPLSLIVAFNPERAEMLFSGSGHSFEEVAAGLRSDRPLPRFPLVGKIRARVKVTRRVAACQNVVGVLPGSDPALKDEHVVVSAHLDHLGVGEPRNGDNVYHGAMDNASGVASLIELARGMHDRGTKPKRSILFLAVTGEEKLLLGSQYFATHPTVTGPLVANLNLDCYLPLFPLKYLEVHGLEESSLGDDIRTLGVESGVEIHTSYEPDRVMFIRSDQYNFIKVGVPALYCSFGFVRGSAEERLHKAWFAERYHGPEDNLDQPVDFVGAAQFNSLFERLLLRVANADRRPSWKPDSFFNRFVR